MSFKYDVLGHVRFGSELNDILTLKGIEDIDIAKQPLYTTKPDLERSGMGFTIMESFMDELNVESILGLGTKVTMKKTIKQTEEVEEKPVTLEEALRG